LGIAARRQTLQSLGAAPGVNDLEAEPRHAALDEAGQRFVVIDVKQRGRSFAHAAAGGT
jgi:hypothetical protein